MHTHCSEVPISLGCVCVWDRTSRGAILLFLQQSRVPSCLCFCWRGTAGKTGLRASALFWRPKSQVPEWFFSIADGILPGWHHHPSSYLCWGPACANAAGSAMIGKCVLGALLGQHWGPFARMVSFICKATFLKHTRWSNAVFPSNLLDNMNFRWAQHVPNSCCCSALSTFEPVQLVYIRLAVHMSGTNQTCHSGRATLAYCSCQCWAGKQHLKWNQAKISLQKHTGVTEYNSLWESIQIYSNNIMPPPSPRRQEQAQGWS